MLVGLKQVFQQQTETLLNSQVQLWSVSSLFRRANNRNQIRIPERETTAAVRFAVHRPTGCKYSFLQRPAVHCPERQLHFHSGRAVQRSVNQRNIFTIISHWSVGGRKAGHFHRHKTFTSIWTRPVCWTTRMELIRRQFYLPPGDTKEDEPTSFFRNLACSWATAGRVGRSSASHSLMAMVTKDHWSYSQTTLCSSTNPTGIESQVPNYGNYVRALNVWALIVLLTIRPTSWTTKNKREAQGIEGQWC